MDKSETIVGLFFSDENNLVYENIKHSEDLSEKKKNELKMLPFKFLGPLFMTAASNSDEKWNIEFIEANLTLHDIMNKETDILQSFFNFNSIIKTEEGITNLFSLIGSPYTEDIRPIYEKMIQYIHPNIIQGLLIKKAEKKEQMNLSNYIRNELKRGLDLIDYSLGTSRKVYWKEQQNFHCVAIIERNIHLNNKEAYFYTFEKGIHFREDFPSYYIMSILPNHYENLICETIESFGKRGIYPHLRVIKLRKGNKTVIYLEEFTIKDNHKQCCGVVLIPNYLKKNDIKNISYYKRLLRQILDGDKPLENEITKFNKNFNSKKWGINTESDFNKIQNILDKSV